MTRIKGLQNLERIEVASAEELWDRCVRPGRAAIVSGLLPGAEVPAWTFDDLRHEVGDLALPMAAEPLGRLLAGLPPEEPVPVPLSDWLAAVTDRPTLDLRCTEQPTPPELLARVPLPSMLATHAPVDDAVSHVFLAPAGAIGHLHYDRDQRDVLMFQLVGRKRYVVIDADRAAALDPIDETGLQRTSGVFLEHLEEVDQLALLEELGAQDGVVEPGEVLFMPALAWHHIEYLDTSLSVSWRLGRSPANRWLAEMVPTPSTHLQAVGTAAHDDHRMATDPVLTNGVQRIVDTAGAVFPDDVTRAATLDRLACELADAIVPASRRAPRHVRDLLERAKLRDGVPVRVRDRVVLRGWFDERPDDVHRAARARVLGRQRWYPAPVVDAGTRATASDLVDRGVELLLPGLRAHGFAQVVLDRTLDNAELIALASALGTPQLQQDDRMVDYVEDDVILDLRQGLPETADQDWQLLFAENYVMLHTELAGAAPVNQPRYQLFQCVDPPVPDAGGQTLLVDQATVIASLDPAHRAVLATTRNASFDASPTFLRQEGDRTVLAYKDTDRAGFAWECDLTTLGRKATIGEVNAAIASLLAAMYRQSATCGIRWRRHLVAVFDNQRWVHGRTFTPLPAGSAPRRLREIRILASA